jgi:hypothetical protein
MLRAALQRSIDALTRVHPELPWTVRDLPPGSTLLDKPAMFDLSPYEETLFLDVDTEVLGRLDFGFEQAARHGLACVICEAPYASRYSRSITGDLIEYNTGVLFFTRADPVAKVFSRWARLAHTLDSAIEFTQNGRRITMPFNDQAGFAVALHEAGFNPASLPLNWNFRPLWHTCVYGPVKVWHDYLPIPPSLRANWEAQAASGRFDFVKLDT